MALLGSWGEAEKRNACLNCILIQNFCQARLKPNEAEVAAVAWLDRPTLECIAATEDGAEDEALGLGKGAPSTVSVVELEKGSAKTLVIPTATFLGTAQGENLERVSTGTKYALRQWLNMSSL